MISKDYFVGSELVSVEPEEYKIPILKKKFDKRGNVVISPDTGKPEQEFHGTSKRMRLHVTVMLYWSLKVTDAKGKYIHGEDGEVITKVVNEARKYTFHNHVGEPRYSTTDTRNRPVSQRWHEFEKMIDATLTDDQDRATVKSAILNTLGQPWTDEQIRERERAKKEKAKLKIAA